MEREVEDYVSLKNGDKVLAYSLGQLYCVKKLAFSRQIRYYIEKRAQRRS